MSSEPRILDIWCPFCGGVDATISAFDCYAHCPEYYLRIPRRIIEYGPPADTTPIRRTA